MLATTSSDDPGTGDDSPAGGGEVSISGQSFPEAALVASMYDLLLTDAGYTTDVRLVDTRDVYMQEFPGDIDVVPEYAASLATFLNTTANGADAEPIATSDVQETIANMEDLLADKGISLLEPSEATDSNAFFVTQEYAESEGVTTLSDMEGKTVTLAASEDCEAPARLRCRTAGCLRDRHRGDPAAGVRWRPDLPVGARR